jgi:phage tail sheath protein FI
MPVTPTFPGVYIQEKPSGVHTIVGVATSITAFIGRAQRGPVNAPKTINSFADYERIFGGLDRTSRTSYAVRDFFLNGGTQAVIVRLYRGDDAHPEKSIALLAADSVTLQAASPGKWGANLRLSVDTTNVLPATATQLGVSADKIFSITVKDTSPGGATETFSDVTLVESSRRLDRVLADSSALVRWQDGQAIPGGLTSPLASGTAKGDPISELEQTLDKNVKDWRTAAQQLAKAVADGATGAALKTAQDAAKAAADARDAGRKALQKAMNDAAGGISDGPLALSDYQPPTQPKSGLMALENVDLFNLLCLPPDTSSPNGDIPSALLDGAASYCEQRRAMLLVDPPASWNNKDLAKQGLDSLMTRSRNAAIFFPRLLELDLLSENQELPFVSCGTVAGLFARTDTERGVWKAPAGIDATLRGTSGLTVTLTDGENGELNQLGINCLRDFRLVGRVSWGSRTLRGADTLTDEYKYIPVRRTALYIEESLFRGTKWVVFEPNDEPLWAQIRLNVGAFMNTLFRQGAFQGITPKDAYFVKCDSETTTQDDINKGIVNIVVGFAPLKPAEFVVIKLQQLTGKIPV